MTEEVLFRVRNSAGRTIVNVSDRNMEAVVWGSVFVGGSGDVKRIEWPLVDAPMVFLKSVPSSFMFRSRIVPGVGGEFGTHINVSAHDACRIDYVVGGFRRADQFVGKEGLFLRDAKGRVGFDQGRRYLRLTNPPPALTSFNGHPFYDGEPTWRRWQAIPWTHFGQSIPVHPFWTDDTYFCWGPNWAYGDTPSNNWYQGFGAEMGGTRYIQIYRFSISRGMTDNHDIGAFQPLNPGAMPAYLTLTCEFVP